MNQPKQSTGQNVVDMQVDIGVLKSQQAEILKNQNRFELKLDSLNTVSQSQLGVVVSRLEIELSKKVDIESFSPYRRTLNLIAGAIALALIGAVMALVLRK